MNAWSNQVVVVTGSSEGLGLELAKAFAQRGAQAVLVGRTKDRLAIAQQSIPGSEAIVADVTSDRSVESLVTQVNDRFGRIDVWVNNVGQSARTSILDCRVEQYETLMEINFLSAVRCTLAALPSLCASGGQIINIGSLAAKTGWFHVAPYATSKHALAAFSHQLTLEGPEEVNCLLVCPGPIQRADAGQRYRDQAEGLNETANQPGAGVKLKGIPPAKLAEKIVKAASKRKSLLVVPGYARWLFAIQQVWPRLGNWILKKAMGSR